MILLKRCRLNQTTRSLIPLAFLVPVLPAPGQSVQVYSEFDRVDPFGAIVSVDRGVKPREILSPAVPRNGFLSLHVAVTVPPHEDYFLYVVPSPKDACHVAVYKEHFTATRAGWIPDALEPVLRLPHFGAMPDPAEKIPQQTTRVYLLDLWIPPNARPPGFRLELQLKVGDWVVWPIEVRVLPFAVPVQSGGLTRPLPPVDQPADAATRAPVEDLFAGVTESREIDVDSVRAVIRRNAIQDVVLARTLDRNALRKQLNAPRPAGAEWYLHVRDWIYRQLQH